MRRQQIVRAVRELAAERPLSLRVRGTCMAPCLNDGALVQVRRAHLYLPGDVVAVFRSDGEALAHRVIGYRWHQGRPALVTQADRASRPDPPTTSARVVGRIDTAVTMADRVRALACFGQAFARWVRRP
jgi:phage repressor protein C with HTH and peptisase S24 domain